MHTPRHVRKVMRRKLEIHRIRRAEQKARERGVPVASKDWKTQERINYFFDPDGDGDL